MSIYVFRRALTAALLASSALAAAAPVVRAEPAATLAAAASPELSAALAEAGAAGDASLLASVYENVRLTPFRSQAVLGAAKALRPDLGPQFDRAARLGLDHASFSRAAAPLLGASADAVSQGPRALPPGAVGGVDRTKLTEFQQDWGLEVIGAQTALDRGLTGKGVTVAVVDTGIDRTSAGTPHSEFAGRVDARSTGGYHWFDPRLAIAAFKAAADAGAPISEEEALKQGFARPATASEDLNGHGTHVAGSIGAAIDGKGMQGVAPGVTILSIQGLASAPDLPSGAGEAFAGLVDASGKFRLSANSTTYFSAAELSVCGTAAGVIARDESRCTQANAALKPGTSEALTYLATQADVRVINGSFGPSPSPGETNWQTGDLSGEAAAVRANLKAGQILAIAAGNERGSHPVYGENPSGIGLFPFIRPDTAGVTNSSGKPIYEGAGGADFSDMTDAALAAAEAADGIRRGRIVVVVATDAEKQIASYSNTCGVAAEWCIAAPGGDGRAGEDGKPRLEEIYSTYPDGQYKAISGTSMATPHVAGAIAVLIQAFPTYTPAQITNILFKTAEDLGAAGTDPVYGRGFLRLDRALNSGPTDLEPTAPGKFTVVVGRDNPETPAGERPPKKTLFSDGNSASQPLRYTKKITSAGSLEKEGDGDLEILGDADFAEGVFVDEGELQIDGVLTTPTVEVGYDGVLAGNGTIEGDVVSDGIIAPGASPGLLTVDGDVTFTDGNQVQIEIDGPNAVEGAGGYDRLLIVGANRAFTLDGSIAPILRDISGSANNDFTPALGQSFAFAAVGNGRITGSFTDLVQPEAGLAPGTRFDVVYGAQTLLLAATPERYADLSRFGIAQGANGRAVGALIDAARPEAGLRPADGAEAFFGSLYLADAGALGQGLEQLAGRIHVDAGQAAVRSFGRLADQIGARRTGLALSGEDASVQGLRYWTVGNAAFADVGAYDVDSYGGTFGADMRLENGALVGGAFRYEHGDVESGLHGSADIDTYQGALYASTSLGGLDIGGSAGLGYGTIDTLRQVLLGRTTGLSGDGDGIGGFVEGRLARAFDLGADTVLLPSVTVGYRAFERDGQREGGSAFALSTDGRTFEEGHVTTALALSRSVTLDNGLTLRPSAGIGYRGDFIEVTDTTTSTLLGRSFETRGEEVGRHAFVGGLGLEISRSETLSFAATYDVELRDRLTEHNVTGSLSLSW